jgi:Zn-dependent peptidase ImmA (M78 family)/transcriptional regulator with XRE-family HTH domain
VSLELAKAYVGLFDPFRLRLARQFGGLRKSDLAKKLGKTPAAVTQYESGAKAPSAATLAAIALALGFPVEFFARDGRRANDLALGQAWYRSLRSTRQLDRDRAEAHALLVSELAETMQRHVRMPPLNLPADLHVSEIADRETIEQKACQLRDFWKVPEAPIASMVRLLEANGILVTRCRVECKEVSAFSRESRKGPVIVIDADQESLDRIRFNAAHELGHLVLHSDVEPANRILERQADQFAASFLMPRHLIRDHLPVRLNWVKFANLKLTWGVSVAALLYQRGVRRMSASGQRKDEWEFPIEGIESITLLPRAMEIVEQKGLAAADLAKEARLPFEFVAEMVSRQQTSVLPILQIQTATT